MTLARLCLAGACLTFTAALRRRAGRRIAELDPRGRVIACVLDAANVTINAGSL